MGLKIAIVHIVIFKTVIFFSAIVIAILYIKAQSEGGI